MPSRVRMWASVDEHLVTAFEELVVLAATAATNASIMTVNDKLTTELMSVTVLAATVAYPRNDLKLREEKVARQPQTHH